MARKPRVEFEGATYHVMCRGNRQAAIFKDDRKKVIAWYIRKKTGVKVEWITRRLHMGTPSNLARYVRAVEQSKEGFLWEQKGEMTS